MPAALPSRRAPRALLALLAVGALGLTACQAAPSEGNGSSASPTLRYASGDAEPDCLDPHVGGNYPQALAATQFLEQLVSRDDAGEITPNLAREWTVSPDGLQWDFQLDERVSFSDGTPLDAAAVAENIEHVQDPDTGSSTGYLAMERVERVVAVDAQNVRFELSAPDSGLLESLSQPWLAIQAPSGLARGTEENCRAPIGTGPFVVSGWTPQEAVTFTRNESYVPTNAGLEDATAGPYDTVEWRFIPDAATRYAALRSGDVDIIDNVQPDALAQARDDDSLTEIDAPRPGSVNRIELNSGKAPFDDARVREAFIRGIDLDPAIDSLFFGTAPRSHSPLASVEKDAVSRPEPLAVDLSRSAALLDEAGWSERDSAGYRVRDGERLSLAFPVSTNQSIPAEISLFEQIQAQARTAGFEITLEPLDLGAWYGRLGANEYDLVSAPYTKVGPDVMRILYHSAGITPAPSGYFANHAQINEPALDELLDRAGRATEPGERSALFAEAQDAVLAGHYILPLYDQQNHFLIGPGTTGVTTTSTVSTPWLAGARPTT